MKNLYIYSFQLQICGISIDQQIQNVVRERIAEKEATYGNYPGLNP